MRPDRAVDAYLRHITIERGLSEHTVAAYRRDLAGYCAWLQDQGIEVPISCEQGICGTCLTRVLEGVDIAIEGADFMVLIEAKVGAAEGDDQLERYHRYLQGIPGKRLRELIFLTPEGRPARNAALQAHVRPLSWAALADVIDNHVRRHSGLAGQPAGLLLNHFAEHVRGLGRKKGKKR